MQLDPKDVAILQAFERPALVIALVARILVGLGLAIAVFLQLYMTILTDLRCEEGVTQLGNQIRCSDPMEMISTTIILLAAIGLIAGIFSRRKLVLVETLIMLLVATMISFLGGLETVPANWETAMTIAALFVSLGSLFAIQHFFQASPKEVEINRV